MLMQEQFGLASQVLTSHTFALVGCNSQCQTNNPNPKMVNRVILVLIFFLIVLSLLKVVDYFKTW